MVLLKRSQKVILTKEDEDEFNEIQKDKSKFTAYQQDWYGITGSQGNRDQDTEVFSEFENEPIEPEESKKKIDLRKQPKRGGNV